MPAFAPAALATAVALSALGAVVLCVLVVLYGFNAEDETLERATRRLVLTRAGHALAATCFTATAILIATVLVQHTPPPSPGAAPAAAIDSGVPPALGQKIEGQEARLSDTEARIRELEDALRRREAVPARPAATRPSPPAPARPAPRTSTRPTDRIAASEPAAPAASPPLASSEIVPSQAPSLPLAAAAPSTRPTTPAQSASRPVPRRTPDVPNKLRDDWREIQRGMDPAGDDFRSAVNGLRRRLLGE
jgi:hypothetical protein